jgi:hypothetical protein
MSILSPSSGIGRDPAGFGGTADEEAAARDALAEQRARAAERRRERARRRRAERERDEEGEGTIVEEKSGVIVLDENGNAVINRTERRTNGGEWEEVESLPFGVEVPDDLATNSPSDPRGGCRDVRAATDRELERLARAINAIRSDEASMSALQSASPEEGDGWAGLLPEVTQNENESVPQAVRRTLTTDVLRNFRRRLARLRPKLRPVSRGGDRRIRRTLGARPANALYRKVDELLVSSYELYRPMTCGIEANTRSSTASHRRAACRTGTREIAPAAEELADQVAEATGETADEDTDLEVAEATCPPARTRRVRSRRRPRGPAAAPVTRGGSEVAVVPATAAEEDQDESPVTEAQEAPEVAAPCLFEFDEVEAVAPTCEDLPALEVGFTFVVENTTNLMPTFERPDASELTTREETVSCPVPAFPFRQRFQAGNPITELEVNQQLAEARRACWHERIYPYHQNLGGGWYRRIQDYDRFSARYRRSWRRRLERYTELDGGTATCRAGRTRRCEHSTEIYQHDGSGGYPTIRGQFIMRRSPPASCSGFDGFREAETAARQRCRTSGRAREGNGENLRGSGADAFR